MTKLRGQELLSVPSHTELVRYAEALGESLLKATLRVSRQLAILEQHRHDSQHGEIQWPLTS